MFNGFFFLFGTMIFYRFALTLANERLCKFALAWLPSSFPLLKSRFLIMLSLKVLSIDFVSGLLL